ncbi:MAG TPA: ABC transporter permease [Bryobacteraceae bacterium]|jgi:predicted permease
MTHDLRFAFRMIASHRWFSAAIVATLALGIGLNTMVFTLVNAVLLKPVPVPGGDRLVSVRNRNVSKGENNMGASYPDFRDYRAHASSFEALEAAMQEPAVLSERGNPPQPYRMDRVSPGIFRMLHIEPVLGRGFKPDDAKPGAEPVLLIGYGVWQSRYGGAHSVVGRAVRINEKAATIVGVMPEGFKFPNNEDLWMPLTPTAELENRSNRTLNLFGILKQGTPLTRARTELDGIAHRLALAYPDTNKDVSALVETFQERFNGGPIKRVFLLMLAAVGFVLLIACANIANMMLSRALGRQREISIRSAMGASRWQLIRQLLIESVLLSSLGGVLGLALSAGGVRWFDAGTQDVGRPYWIHFAMDYSVFGYFAALCILSGLFFGLAPALRSSRVDLNSALKDGIRSAGTRRGGKLAGFLVIAQFALTLVLLTGAGMFARSFLDNLSLNEWVPADRLMSAGIRLPKGHYATPEARLHFFEQLLPRLRALPGVTHAVIASNLPGLFAPSRRIEIEHAAVTDPAHAPSASVVIESPRYFDAINLPLLLGRDFNQMDGAAGRQSAIVTKQFAERYWPNQNAIGKRLRFYTKDKPGDWISVIGVSANLVQEPNEKAPNPLLFVPYRQEAPDSMALAIRSAAAPASLASAVRATVQSLDQDLPLFDVRTLAKAIERTQWFLRLFGIVFAVFALIALVMASVGIYAVMAQAATSRTREIGIRMALGATSRNILRLVLSRGVIQLAAGLIFGLAAAFPAARLMAALPFRFSATDPAVFLTVSLLLAAVGLFACWLPARRAAALNPVNAIREE